MTSFAWAVLAACLFGVLIALWAASERRLRQEIESSRKQFSDTLAQTVQSVHRQIDSLDRHLDSAMTDTRHSVREDLKHSGRMMSDIHNRLGELGEASKRIFDIGEDIIGLQELLRAPKIRGGMGEFFLEDLLSQILPRKFYETQHGFKDGSVVDAVIRLGPSMICIDSKFPLETFNQLQAATEEEDERRLRREFHRGVKKHIDDISSKYILPMEGTYDFALMYIPAENVYYETVIRDSKGEDSSRALFEYSVKKKVIPVSPNSIYAYLQVILLGLKGFQIESKTKEVLNRLASIRTDFSKVRDDFSVAARHLGNTGKSFERVQSRMDRLGANLEQIGAAEEPEALDSQADARAAIEDRKP